MTPTAMERLRWLILREFCVLPGSSAEREMSDGDVIFAGVNMVLDRETAHGGENLSFDEDRFRKIRESETL